ncbi:MAG: hypothetical protein IPO27_01085 [Bacteroidetes bacterium]|nr:hypothetical protein [Bacteroidota bacterium]
MITYRQAWWLKPSNFEALDLCAVANKPGINKAYMLNVYVNINSWIAKDGNATVTVCVDGATTEVTLTSTYCNKPLDTSALNVSTALTCLAIGVASQRIYIKSLSIVAMCELCSSISQVVFKVSNPGVYVTHASRH